MATVDERTKRAIGVYRELARANDAVNEVIERQLYKSDLGIAQFRILDWLLHEGPTPQAKLAELLVLSKSGISQVLGRLMAKSLVAQWTKDGYTRQKTIHLTPQGRAMIERLFPKQATLMRAHMSALNEREQETLRKLCQKLSAGNAQRYIAELTEEE